MSLLKAIKAQLGLSNTATQNFTLTAEAADGTMKLARGNAGATTQDILTVDAGGNVVAAQNLTVTGKIAQSTAQSMVRLNTANGYGSTNTRIRRFTTTVTNQGSDITYADSATLGASFTINANGVYAVSYSDQYTSGDSSLITINDSTPTAAPVVGDVLAASNSTAANAASCAAWCGYLSAGSVIRARSYNGTATGTTTAANQFTITRIA